MGNPSGTVTLNNFLTSETGLLQKCSGLFYFMAKFNFQIDQLIELLQTSNYEVEANTFEEAAQKMMEEFAKDEKDPIDKQSFKSMDFSFPERVSSDENDGHATRSLYYIKGLPDKISYNLIVDNADDEEEEATEEINKLASTEGVQDSLGVDLNLHSGYTQEGSQFAALEAMFQKFSK